MQFLVQPQATDFEGQAPGLPWRDFANGEMLDNGLSMTLRRSRSKAALFDSQRADARFKR
jgi:hypothetical protein